MVVVCLLPATWYALGTNYLTLKIICFTALVTQIITVINFYLQRNTYSFYNHRPFEFNALSGLEAFLILGVFLWMLVFLVKMAGNIINFSFRYHTYHHSVSISNFSGEVVKINLQQNIFFPISIILIIILSLPIKLWMFGMGIGLVGTPPPQLPYKLSGILFYLFNYIVPVLLAYLYIKTRRSSLLISFAVSIYAILIGILSVSKSVVLIPIAPIVAFAWFDKRWLIFLSSIFFASFGVMAVIIARSIVHIYDGFSINAFLDLGGLGTIIEVVTNTTWSSEIFKVFIDIANRFEGFQSMILASKFNAEAIGGPWNILLNLITFGSNSIIDHDSIHMEYFGYTLPSGIFGVGQTFNAWLLMAVNNNIFMILPFLIYASVVVIIFEDAMLKVSKKYLLLPTISNSILFFIAMWFYTGPATLIFFIFLLFTVIFSILPRIVILNKFKPQ